MSARTPSKSTAMRSLLSVLEIRIASLEESSSDLGDGKSESSPRHISHAWFRSPAALSRSIARRRVSGDIERSWAAWEMEIVPL